MTSAPHDEASGNPVNDEGYLPGTSSKSVGVIGAGIAGATASSRLSSLGCHVSVFDLGRGPGGRMSQRRDKVQVETSGETREVDVRSDHGAQSFSASSPEVTAFLEPYQEQGLVAEWRGAFGTWDAGSHSFDPAPGKQRLVCVPGMNSLCQKALDNPRIKAMYSTHVAAIQWDSASQQWEVQANSGEELGRFDGIVISAAYRTFQVRVQVPDPLESSSLKRLSSGVADVPAYPCFALMLSFPHPLPSIPFDGAKIVGSSTLAWAARDSSKPGRSKAQEGRSTPGVENWVVHSTAEYAKSVMDSAPPGRPSPELLSRIGEEMQAAFKALFPAGADVAEPVLVKVHRWGGAFPSESRAPKGEKFLSGGDLPVVACGDFCISPRVDAAIESALAAASHLALKLQVESSRM